MARAFSWVPTNSLNCHRFQHKAVVVGREAHDESPIYVGRTTVDGELLPCKVIPRHNVAYVSSNGKEVQVHNFEIYCMSGPILEWVDATNGFLPEGAVEAGVTKDGEKLYLGRGTYKGSITPGKIHCSHRCIYIPFGGKEVSLREYQAMVLKYY